MNKPQRHLRPRRRALFALLLSLLIACVVGPSASAQSGRRPPKRSSTPPTVIPVTEPVTPKPEPKPALPQQSVIVGFDALGQSMNLPSYLSEQVWAGFFERFRQAASINIISDKSMGRGEARERAKKETEIYVVLLELQSESFDSGRTGVWQVDPNELLVAYTILTPVTAKVKAQGRVHVSNSRSVINTRLPGTRTTERQLFETGRETAERVLAALGLRGPGVMR